MKILDLDRKKRAWLFVLLAIAVVALAAIIVCALVLPDVLRARLAKTVEAKKIEGELKSEMLNIITPLVILFLFDAAALLTLLFKNTSKESYFSTKKITYLAIFTAISYVFYIFIKFNLPIFPSFLDFQISDMPALLCGFMMGPWGGVIVIVLKIALKLPFSSTGFVGELGDLILGIAFVLPAALIYKHMRTKKGAIIGLACGTAACVAASLLVNRFLLIPFFLSLGYYGGTLNGIAGALKPLYSNITEKNFYLYYLGLAVLPFNILRCFLSAAVTFLIYKRLERLFVKMLGNVRKQKNQVEQAQPAQVQND